MPRRKAKKAQAAASATKTAAPTKSTAVATVPVADQAVTMLDDAPAWGFVLLQGILILMLGLLILGN